MNTKSNQTVWIVLLMCTISLLSSLTACAQSSDIKTLPENNMKPGWHEGALDHDGLERVFRFYIPKGLSKNAPMVLLLHGGGGNMDKIFRPSRGTREWMQIAEQENFLLMVPSGINVNTGSPRGDHQHWNDGRPGGGKKWLSQADDVGFIEALLDWTAAHFDEKHHKIDADRIYVTGSSNGGMMTYRLITELPERFAAAAVFIANRPENSECPEATKSIPLLIVNGTKDPLMPFAGGSVALGTVSHGKVLSAEQTRDYWISVNHANPVAAVTKLPDRDPGDGSRIICEFYSSSAKGGAPVKFCRVEGGGHNMPSIDHELSRFAQRFVGPQNHDIEGARFAWEFLQQHKK